MLELYLTDFVYLADMSKLVLKVYDSSKGIQLVVKGYNDKSSEFLIKVAKNLKKFSSEFINDTRFAVWFEEQRKKLL